MTLKKIPWASYLGPSPPLPFDVTFRIIEGEHITGHIGAHRYLLATCSSVFRTEFFGLLAEREKSIDIKETSLDAFKYLIAYIYGCGSATCSEADLDAEQLFAILNLAERYDIIKLRHEVSDKLKTIQIQKENVIEVAKVAEAYRHFEAVSTSVLLACSRLLKDLLDSEPGSRDFRRKFGRSQDKNLIANLMKMEEAGVEVEEDPDDIGSVMKELFQGDDPSKVAKVVQEPPANLNSVNWIDLMDPGFGIPPDVCFRIIESAVEKNNNNISAKEFAGEVFAHKYLLAASSDAFKDKFFSSDTSAEQSLKHSRSSDPVSDEDEGMGEEEFEEDDLEKVDVGIEVVEVECSSLNAFKVMINYMYGKYPTLRGAEEICEIFEIVDLAERFEVSGLEEEYRTAMFLYFREMPRWSSQPN